MQAAHRQHNISDQVWAKLEPLLPGQRGMGGGIARDNRLFINAVCWIVRTGAPWRDLPPDLGGWKNTHRRYKRWADTGVWKRLRPEIVGEPELTWLMIDARYVKAHTHATGARGGSQDIAMTKGG
jgi:transposase